MKVPKTKFKGEESIRKYSKRLLALLLACIMVLTCGVTAFADEIDYEAQLPVKNILYNSYVVPGYDYVYKIQVPCSGTVTFTAKLQEKAADDYATRMFLYNEIPNYMIGEPVNDFYITNSNFSSKKTETVKKASTVSTKIKSLKKGNKCYSKWSAKKAVKVTK